MAIRLMATWVKVRASVLKVVTMASTNKRSKSAVENQAILRWRRKMDKRREGQP
jgi:hypothetical protein